MPDAVLLPKLGQTVEEATVVRWLKNEGDTVKKGDVLFEIETDKAVLEAESFFEGTLLKVLVKEGETAPVSTVAAYIGKPGEAIPDKPPAAKPEAGGQKAEVGGRTPEARDEKPEKTEPALAPPPPPPAPPAAPVAPPPPAAAQPSRPTSGLRPPAPEAKRLIISPRARALARSKVIDPAHIKGSGPNGRIVVKDVEAYLDASGYNALRISASARKLAALEAIDLLTVRGTGHGGRITVADVERKADERPKPLTKMRKIISQRLSDSFRDIPHFYVSTSVDMTDLLAYRQEIKELGVSLKVTDFILEAVILTLKEIPILNSVTDGETVRWRGTVDLGMAVGLDDGLVVPVIRQAEDLAMAELNEIAQGLAARARAGKLMPDEMTGSSFTVSNMGMLGVENFNAIINPGEAGILAVSSTIPTPVVRDGKVVVRSMMRITLSVDHRIVDGTVGAEAVNAIKSKLEDVELWKSMI